MPKTYHVACSRCKQDKWPYLSAPPPIPYVCQLCREGRGKPRAKTAEQQSAFTQFRALAEPYRFRVQPDQEGFPILRGRRGQIEWYDPQGRELAVYSDHPRLFEKLWAIPGVRRHQTGDREMRAVFPPEALEQVAEVIRARRRRHLSSETARKMGSATAYRCISAP